MNTHTNFFFLNSRAIQEKLTYFCNTTLIFIMPGFILNNFINKFVQILVFYNAFFDSLF